MKKNKVIRVKNVKNDNWAGERTTEAAASTILEMEEKGYNLLYNTIQNNGDRVLFFTTNQVPYIQEN